MANVTIFDPITKKTKTAAVTLEAAVIQSDPDAVQDYFIKVATAAKKLDGTDITPKIIRELSDLVRGTTQHDGITVTDYASMTEAIEDYILNMIEGDGGLDAMNFA